MARATVTNIFVTTNGGAPNTVNVQQDSVSGGFTVYTAAAYAAIYSGSKIGPCIVTDRTASANTKSPSSPVGYLDAGTTIPVAGPGLAPNAALAVASTNPGPVYSLVQNGGLASGGKYTLNGTGGKGVGAFTASVNFPAAFTVAAWDTINTIDRSKPLTLNWTGGQDQVVIIGSSSAVLGKDASNSNILHTTAFTCTVPAAPGTFTVPTSVLSVLLPAGVDAPSLAKGSASLAVETVTSQLFTAPLTAGGRRLRQASPGFWPIPEICRFNRLDPGDHRVKPGLFASFVSATLAVLAAPSLCHTQAGVITTVAGGGTANATAGAQATNVRLAGSFSVAVDGAGNLYIADGGNRVWKVNAAGTMILVAGNGVSGLSGDGGPAINAAITASESQRTAAATCTFRAASCAK